MNPTLCFSAKAMWSVLGSSVSSLQRRGLAHRGSDPTRKRPDASRCRGRWADFNHAMSADPKQILILGGGFAGVYTARYLEKFLRADEASITLVNRENYWVYQPMLAEVISGSISLTNVVSPIRRLCPRTNLIMREVEDINLKNQTVTISPGSVRASSNSNTITWSSRSGLLQIFMACPA